jgi:hypothetical protein
MREVSAFLRAPSSQESMPQRFRHSKRPTFRLTKVVANFARLPTANGGFGLRSIADHCGIAFVAATVAAHELFPALLSQQTRDQLARSADTWCRHGRRLR